MDALNNINQNWYEENNKKYWLNDYGLVLFFNLENKGLFAHRNYHWVDRIIFIDETNGRKSKGETKLENFNLAEWAVVTKEEYDSVISGKYSGYYIIHAIRRKIRINKLLE